MLIYRFHPLRTGGFGAGFGSTGSAFESAFVRFLWTVDTTLWRKKPATYKVHLIHDEHLYTSSCQPVIFIIFSHKILKTAKTDNYVKNNDNININILYHPIFSFFICHFIFFNLYRLQSFISSIHVFFFPSLSSTFILILALVNTNQQSSTRKKENNVTLHPYHLPRLRSRRFSISNISTPEL